MGQYIQYFLYRACHLSQCHFLSLSCGMTRFLTTHFLLSWLPTLAQANSSYLQALSILCLCSQSPTNPSYGINEDLKYFHESADKKAKRGWVVTQW